MLSPVKAEGGVAQQSDTSGLSEVSDLDVANQVRRKQVGRLTEELGRLEKTKDPLAERKAARSAQIPAALTGWASLLRLYQTRMSFIEQGEGRRLGDLVRNRQELTDLLRPFPSAAISAMVQADLQRTQDKLNIYEKSMANMERFKAGAEAAVQQLREFRC
jgi:hypothetical protein